MSKSYTKEEIMQILDSGKYFTVQTFAAKMQQSPEYVRQCLRGWKHPKSKAAYKLSEGYIAVNLREYSLGQHWIIFKDEPVSQRQRRRIDLGVVNIPSALTDCLISYGQLAVIHQETVSARVDCLPDGRMVVSPMNAKPPTKTDNVLLAFSLSWQMHLGKKLEPGMNLDAALDKVLSPNHGYVRPQIRSDFERRCLWCGEYKPSTIRSGAKFCADDHKNEFRKWILKLAKEDANNHPSMISKRLMEIYPAMLE